MKKLLAILLLIIIPKTASAAGIETVSGLGEALELNTSKVKIITREEWGADENLRFYDGEVENPKVIELSEETKKKFADELKIKKKITKQDGKTLIWPLEYSAKVTKFIIHHTATDVKPGEAMQNVQDIYHSHAVFRGWGDIGYNYLIDQEGNIYEGRYGGEGVIGGHAGVGNIGSIGIAVLGTYSDNKVPKKVLAPLIKLIAEKSKIYGIDPNGYSQFRGEISPNVIGHRDIMHTECPGEKLQTLLPVIRTLAGQLAGTTTVSNIQRFQSNQGYNYEDKSGLLYVEMQPGEEKEIEIKLKNTGEKEWGGDTFLVVNSDPNFENVISFPDKKGSMLAKITEKSVKTGETAVFKFKVQTELKSDLVYLNLAPVIGGKKISKYVILPVLVTNADYSYEIIGSKMPKPLMKAGEKFEGWVDIKNVGNVTWKGTGKNRVTLGADNERDRISEFADPKGNRIGYLMQDQVKPGETGRFLLRLKAPDGKGAYNEYFTPVMEGITWFDNKKTSFKTFVYEKKYDAGLKEVVSDKQAKVGETRTMWVKLRNVGGVKWSREDFTVGVMTSAPMEVTNVKLSEDIVLPGETGTIIFTVKAPKETGRVLIYLRPRVKNTNIYRGALKFPVMIVKEIKTGKNRNGENIRVKISFDKETPVISADGKFKMYVNDVEKSSFDAGEEVEIDADTNDIYRFVPDGTAILNIANFENRPAWNTSLNDNKYRGVLEVRKENGKMIVVNELPLEDYLKGLAENANDELYEKMKALIVLARSYALYYMTVDDKFPGAPYDLDDTPEKSQKYLGYGYELRSPNNAKAVLATRGRVVKYNGQVIKTPYFTQSDGRTRSAEEVWGWTNTPYLVSVPDPYCEGLELKGHGVGMSAEGARGMAGAGGTYKEIIGYFFKNVVISKVY